MKDKEIDMIIEQNITLKVIEEELFKELANKKLEERSLIEVEWV